MAAEDPPPPEHVLPGWLERTLFGQPLKARRAAQIIAGAALTLTIAGGVTAWLIDRDDFNSLGDGLWWALQTVTTVGYGDVVPTNPIGRLIGTVLMLQGIALVAVVTAAVTATFIEQQRRRGHSTEAELLAKLERIESRLSEMEPRASGPGER